VTVAGLTQATAIAAGSDHTCALRAGGTAQCWGSGAQGRLGNGSTSSSTSPVAVSGLDRAVTLATGEGHNCASRVDGTLRCWGANASGQIGDGTTTARSTPVQVAGLAGVVTAGAGRLYSCAVRSDGSARCWGANASGQLGTGTTTSFTTPIQVASLSSAFAIAAGEGGSHTCALRASGVPACWGLNQSGEVGDGTTTNRSLPTNVPSFAANIDPLILLAHRGKVADVLVFVACDEDRTVHIAVGLAQDDLGGDANRSFACTGRLETYPLKIVAHGHDRFAEGDGKADLVAEIRGHGVATEVLEWSRKVRLVTEPDLDD
jgi:alpha-tubulin suppressor-like RCC1 family protein